MNKNIFRIIVLSTFTIGIMSGVLGYYYPTEAISSFYEHYNVNYITEEPAYIVQASHFIGVIFMLVSVIGMLLFWKPSRLLFIISYLFMLPSYYIEPPFIYSPIAQILYDIGMIGSGVILATIFLEPINGLFTKASNK